MSYITSFIILLTLFLIRPATAYPDVGSCVECARENLYRVNNLRESNFDRKLLWNDNLAELAVAHSKAMFEERNLYQSCTDCFENVGFS